MRQLQDKVPLRAAQVGVSATAHHSPTINRRQILARNAPSGMAMAHATQAPQQQQPAAEHHEHV